MTTQQALQALIARDPKRSYIVRETSQCTQHDDGTHSTAFSYDVFAFEQGCGSEIEFVVENADLQTALNLMLTNLDLSSVPCNP